MKKLTINLNFDIPCGTYTATTCGYSTTFNVGLIPFQGTGEHGVRGTVKDKVFVTETGIESRILGKLANVGLKGSDAQKTENKNVLKPETKTHKAVASGDTTTFEADGIFYAYTSKSGIGVKGRILDTVTITDGVVTSKVLGVVLPSMKRNGNS